MAKGSESSLAQFLRDEVPDWGDDMVARARYKAFTGQRADWGNRLQFWRSVILKCARHLDVISIDPNIVQSLPFSIQTDDVITVEIKG